MQNTPPIQIEPKFFEVFGAWFNVDLLPYEDDVELVRTAGVCASDLMKQVPDTLRLTNELSEVLRVWPSDFVMNCIQATDVDWLADGAAEKKLRLIIEAVKGDLYTLHRQQKGR